MKIQSKTAHRISPIDKLLMASIENGTMQLAEFNHSTHLKLVYCYLAELGLAKSFKKMSQTLKFFLSAKGVDGNKFHKTLTHAWIQTVWHHMQHNDNTNSADEFLNNNQFLLNKDLMLSHYSHELLFSDKARKQFIPPDLNPLP